MTYKIHPTKSQSHPPPVPIVVKSMSIISELGCNDNDMRSHRTLIPELCSQCVKFGVVNDWLRQQPQARSDVVRAWGKMTSRDASWKSSNNLSSSSEDNIPSDAPKDHIGENEILFDSEDCGFSSSTDGSRTPPTDLTSISDGDGKADGLRPFKLGTGEDGSFGLDARDAKIRGWTKKLFAVK